MLRRTLPFHKKYQAACLGIPSAGKSSLFNALIRAAPDSKARSKTGNFAFTTVAPVRGKAVVDDTRLDALAKFAKSKRIIGREVDLIDVAGLIAGASKGEGMGNSFLADLRPASVLVHVLRCFRGESLGFDDPDPVAAMSVVDAELILADLQSVEKKAAKENRKKTSSEDSQFSKEVLQWLEDGKAARDFLQPLPPLKEGQAMDEKRRRAVQALAKRQQMLDSMQLLSAKPTIFALNVDAESCAAGNKYSAAVEKHLASNASSSVGSMSVRVCAKLEEELAELESREEQLELLSVYGLEEPASAVLLRRVFDKLGLHTFFTVGPEIAKAWAFPAKSSCRDAAAEIHGDFAKHFRQGRVHKWDKFTSFPSFREAEVKMQSLGGDEVLEDGSVLVVEHDAKR